MGFWDSLLGRSKPVEPDLDQLFGLPSAALTLQAAISFTPTGAGSVCFASIEGGAFTQVQQEVRALLDADSERAHASVEFSRDAYGYSWLLSRRGADDLPALVGDLHAVNTALQDGGFGPQLLCSLVPFRDAELRPSPWSTSTSEAPSTRSHRSPDRCGTTPGAPGQGRDQGRTAHRGGPEPLVPAVGSPGL